MSVRSADVSTLKSRMEDSIRAIVSSSRHDLSGGVVTAADAGAAVALAVPAAIGDGVAAIVLGCAGGDAVTVAAMLGPAEDDGVVPVCEQATRVPITTAAAPRTNSGHNLFCACPTVMTSASPVARDLRILIPPTGVPGTTRTTQRAGLASSSARQIGDRGHAALHSFPSGPNRTIPVNTANAVGERVVSGRRQRAVSCSKCGTYERLAPAVGLEPTTKRLTAARSTTELRRNACVDR